MWGLELTDLGFVFDDAVFSGTSPFIYYIKKQRPILSLSSYPF